MIQCHYCARSGLDNKLEYIPHKKEYYCKRCEYHFSEDSINDMLPKIDTEINSEIKAGGFPLTVVKEEIIDNPNEILENSKEDKTGLRVGGIPKGALDKNKSKK